MKNGCLSVVLLLLLACGGENETESTETETETTETETETETEPEPAGPTHVVELRPQADGYQAGTLGQFAVHVEGRGEWHLNQDFPFSVEVSGPDGVTFPKSELGKDDAAEFGDERARVDVPFTASAAGEHAVECTVRFAVCNPSSCVPKTETVALNLAVN